MSNVVRIGLVRGKNMTTTAVVVGASVAGLLAARVLSEHFDEVKLVERDQLDQAAAPRKGVPQGQHIHLLWSGGMDIIESYFPGLGEELKAMGGVTFDNSRDMRWFHHGVWKLRIPTGLQIHSQSRPLLEHCLRQRVRALDSIELMTGHTLDSLQLDAGEERVTGVNLVQGQDPSQTLQVQADLVIDASGRTAASLRSLKELGYPPPEEDAIGVNIGYATRIYKQPKGSARDWQCMAVYAKAPESYRLGVIFPIEGERWIVTLVGLRGHFPRTDNEEDFLDFARSLDRPDLYQAIESATPEGPIQLIRYPNQLRRHFERLPRYPSGILPLGDTLCSLNPLYGQGMTLCTQEAQILDQCLADHGVGGLSENFTRAYFKKISPVIDTAWLLGSGSDFLYPETSGKRTALTPVLGWYMSRLLQLSSTSPMVLRRFLQVIHFKKPLSVLLWPDVMARVLFGKLFGAG